MIKKQNLKDKVYNFQVKIAQLKEVFQIKIKGNLQQNKMNKNNSRQNKLKMK